MIEASPMMFEELHTYGHTLTTQITSSVVFSSMFSRNWTLEKSDGSNRGDSISTRNLKSKGGGEAATPPMMFEEELIQIGVQLHSANNLNSRGGIQIGWW